VETESLAIWTLTPLFSCRHPDGVQDSPTGRRKYGHRGIRRVYKRSVEISAFPRHTWLTSPALDRSGAHLDDDNQIKAIPEQFEYASGIENEERLWALSEGLVGKKFVY
jgi:hypothetical protein